MRRCMNPFARNWDFEHAIKIDIKCCFATSARNCADFVGASAARKFSPDFGPVCSSFWSNARELFTGLEKG
jgi:hypothetical protein